MEHWGNPWEDFINPLLTLLVVFSVAAAAAAAATSHHSSTSAASSLLSCRKEGGYKQGVLYTMAPTKTNACKQTVVKRSRKQPATKVTPKNMSYTEKVKKPHFYKPHTAAVPEVH